MVAAANNILARRSSNCSLILSQSESSSSFSSSLAPYFSVFAFTYDSDKPDF